MTRIPDMVWATGIIALAWLIIGAALVPVVIISSAVGQAIR